jgi:hypothetical protein
MLSLSVSNKWTKWKEYSSSWEADIHLAGQNTPPPDFEPKYSVLFSQ